jgi:O-antigen ligase
VLFFILSFVPSLYIHPTTHGFGVFIEWIVIPIIFSFLLFVYTSHNINILKWLLYALLTILFFVSVVSIVYLFFNITTFDGRLSSFFLSPNHLAMFITPLIFIVGALYFISHNLFIKIYSIFTICLALFVLFFTNSFTSIFSLLITTLIITFIHIKQKLLLIILFILIMLLLVFSGYQKIININPNLHRNSLSSRIMIWDSATFYIQNNTTIAINGLDNFQNIYLDAQQYFIPYLEWSAPTPHNLLLTLWISGGFFSVLFFCLICARWLFISLTTYYKIKNTAILFFIAALLTILINSIFDTPVWKNDLSVIFWLIIILQNYFK